MRINRRTYTLYPERFGEALALAKEIRSATKEELGKDIRVLTALYGPFGTIVLELEYENAVEQEEFSSKWHALLRERGYVERWFKFVQSGTNQLWVDNR